MRRTKTVTASFEYGDVEIAIRVNTRDLTKGEANRLISALASDAMCSIPAAPFVHAALSDVRVW
jgi:hypothetical protein